MACASDKSESSKSFVTIVENCVECPVCLETVKVPFKQCSRGHVVCLSCTTITKIMKCPICEGPFTQENPVSLKNILEALPRHCIYSQDGCKEIVEPGNDHEELCGYRPITCNEFGCYVKMPVVKVLDHYNEHHGKIGKVTERIVEEFEHRYFCSPVWLFDNLFWILNFNDRESELTIQKVYFLATPIGKLGHECYVRVTIENGDFVVTNTLKATSWDEKIPLYEVLRGNFKMPVENERFCMKTKCCQVHDWESKTKKKTKFKLHYFKKE